MWAALIVARLIQLSVVQHGDFKRLALQQQQRTVEVRAPRGTILDRNGQRLAMSLPVESVCVDPLRISDVAVASDILSKILSIDARDLLGKMQAAVEARRGFLWV